MIDPSNITNYNLTKAELEEILLFWICAAGKNGTTTARLLEVLLTKIISNNITPFEAIILKESDDNMPDDMYPEGYKSFTDLVKESGIGCYNHKARTMSELAHSKLDLKTCSTEDLEKIYGIGMKTSRCFIIHSRENAQLAGLDTHMLKHLKANSTKDVPTTTPSSKKLYKRLELEVLKLAKEANSSPADYDLNIWNSYAVRQGIK